MSVPSHSAPETPTASEALSAAVDGLDVVEDRVQRARELHGDGPAAEPLALLLGEVRVMRRRTLNISRFLRHPVAQRGEP